MMTSWLTAPKNSRQAITAILASPPIHATAPAFDAGREAGLSITPLFACNRNATAPTATATVKCLTSGGVPLPSIYFLCFWPVVGLLATACLLRKVLRRYLIFGANPFMQAMGDSISKWEF